MLNRLLFLDTIDSDVQTFSTHIYEQQGVDEDTGEEYINYYGYPGVPFNNATLAILYTQNLIFENCPDPAPTKIIVDAIGYALVTPRNYKQNYYSIKLADDSKYLPLENYSNQDMPFSLV